MKVWYDVCNDYSLESRETIPNDLKELDSFVDKWGGVVYYTEEEGAIYYLHNYGLQGCYLEEID